MRSGAVAAVRKVSGPPMQYPCTPIFFFLSVCGCASRKATYDFASLMLASAVNAAAIGITLARSSGLLKSNDPSTTGAFALR